MNNNGYYQIRELIAGLPDQLIRGWEAAGAVPESAGIVPEPVVICAMGGSALGADLVRSLIEAEGGNWLKVVRDYSLPTGLSRQAQVLTISYSGNTEETLTAYELARKRRVPVVAITSGGKLAELARQDGVPLVLIPGDMPPRCAVGLMSGAILGVLHRLGRCRSFWADITETVRLLQDNLRIWQGWAVRASRRLIERLVIIYSTSRILDVAAYRWQSQLNENAKLLAHWAGMPEASHNEIMGYGAPRFLAGRVAVIALFDPSTHPRTRLRLEEMLRLVRPAIATRLFVESSGRTVCARLFSLVVRGDLLSVEIARRLAVDPMVIPRIDRLKEILSRKGLGGA